MDKDQRIQGLLEANNKLVENNRLLKAQLKEDQNLFAFYAENHRQKGTPDGDEKAKRNYDAVDAIDRVFDLTAPK